jgi:hypothetical protein
MNNTDKTIATKIKICKIDKEFSFHDAIVAMFGKTFMKKIIHKP